MGQTHNRGIPDLSLIISTHKIRLTTDSCIFFRSCSDYKPDSQRISPLMHLHQGGWLVYKEGLSNSSIKSYTLTLKCFLSWCSEEGYTKANLKIYKAAETTNPSHKTVLKRFKRTVCKSVSRWLASKPQPIKCNFPVGSCSRRLDGANPLFSPKRKCKSNPARISSGESPQTIRYQHEQ